ncbi:uncharacterized protein V6R79_009445 [Siganus canaliculatus]
MMMMMMMMMVLFQMTMKVLVMVPLCLLSLVHGGADAFRIQHVDPPPAGGLKEGAGLAGKLLRLDGLARKENDVLEPKRKRSFPGNSAPLDRLSISAMETKQAAKQSKVVALPRRRVSLPPMDRIGMRRLPSSRG